MVKPKIILFVPEKRVQNFLIVAAMAAIILSLLVWLVFFRVHGGILELAGNGVSVELSAREARRVYYSLDHLPGDISPKKGEFARYRLVIRKGKEEKVFLFRRGETMANMAGEFFEPSKKGQKILREAIERLRNKSPFGEAVPWKEADALFPFDAVATVRDLETGLTFRVQRREGSSHADCQPLTAIDTAVMKRAFGDRWTWRRRAVVVKVSGRRIAASMAGMPHGAGIIGANNFDGHFCIHFLDSKTHAGSAVNQSHQLMVWKAAGIIEEKLFGASPEKVAGVLFEALDQQDLSAAEKMISFATGEKEDFRLKLLLLNWISIAPYDFKVNRGRRSGEKEVTFQVEMGLQSSGEKLREVKAVMVKGENMPWLVKYESLKTLFDKK